MTHSNSFVSSSLKIRAAFWAALVVLCSVVLLPSSTVSAQNALIHHTILKNPQHPPHSGRDFWFSMMSNYWGEDLGGKYMRIYITSAENCTAFVESNGVKTPVPIQSYKVGSFKIPEFWEVESSGEVETKAIHVYSPTANITVYDMSHNPYTSDGSYIIPTIGWGQDYVVGAYGSLFEGGGNYVFDLPSTMVVTADVDNTQVTITPSCDCRQCTSGNASGNAAAAVVVFPQGEPAQFTLNRGQCVQMMPVRASDADNFDMTGTIVHANVPVGVSGGSVCPNIPADFPYCDHVEDMLPPIRTWAETYYATNPIQPPGMPGHDFARYLFISSVPGQEIDRYDCASGTHTECIINNQYGIYWDELELGQRFTSNAPFLCVWYINSASYPDNNNGLGDPAECVINPQEQYTKTVLFETPQSIGNIVPYVNYANIIVNVKDELNTKFDGQGIEGKSKQCIDGIYEIFNIPQIAPGAHLVTGDTLGVGVYVYGYGYDESYAWAGSFGTGTFHSPDTVAPAVDTTGECAFAYIHVSDSGLLPDGVSQQSLLSAIQADTDYNMSYTIDPNFVEGVGIDTSDYWMYPTDPTLPAYLRMEVWDVAGNLTTVTSIYKPQIDSIKPPLNNLGVYNAPTPQIGWDTIYNTGQTTFNPTPIHLKYGNVGFTLFDSTGGPLDNSPIPPGGRRVVEVKFVSLNGATAIDSIVCGNICDMPVAAVIGSGGAADFVVSDQSWNVPYVPGVCYPKNVIITNLSNHPITIDTGWWADQVHFHAVSTFPVVLKALGNSTFTIDYCPDSLSVYTANTTQGLWFSGNVLGQDIGPDKNRDSVRLDKLTGIATKPSAIFYTDLDTTFNCIGPNQFFTASFTVKSTGTSQTTINKVTQTDTTDFNSLTGTLANGQTWDPTKVIQPLAIGDSATISVVCPLPVGVDTTFTDFITAYDGLNDTIGKTLEINIHIIYAAATSTVAAPVAPVEYQAAVVNNTTTFIIQNTAKAPLDIEPLVLQAGKYNGAFTLSATLVPGGTPVNVFPDTLQIGQSLLVSVHFNDSLFNDLVQTAQLTINSTNACTLPLTENFMGTITHPGPTISGYPVVPILSCDTRVDSIPITDSGAMTTIPDNVNASFTVQKVQWLGPDNFFTTTIAPGTVINGSTNFTAATPENGTPNLMPNVVKYPVTFTPPATSGASVTYNNQLQITCVNVDGTTFTITQPVSGTAGAAEVSETGVLVNTTNTAAATSGVANDALQLKANASVNINVAGVPVDSLGITGIQLTYIIPNRNLLTVTGGGFQVSNALANAGWSVVPNAPGSRGPNFNGTGPGTGTADTLVYMIAGSKLTANTLSTNPAALTTLGSLSFQADLSQAGNSTPITLQPLVLYAGANTVGACIGNDVQSTSFTLNPACGDTSLRAVMDGHGSLIQFIGAATPDPVSGGNVAITYSNRGAASLTLSIFDELGNEVARPVDNVSQDAGTWQVTTDVSKLPSGTYTYRLSGKSATGPMVISNQFVIQR